MAFHEYSKQSGSGLPLKIQLFRGYNKARQWVTESGENGIDLVMKFEYTIDPYANLIRMKCSGKGNVQAWIEHGDKVHSDPLFRSGMNTLADFSEAELEYSYERALKFKEYVSGLETLRGKCQRAVSAPSPESRNAIKLVEMILDSPFIKVRLYDNIEEAEKWLRESVEGKLWI
jgi:hypothetical protein